MEDGNIAITKDDRNVLAPLGSLYGDRGCNLTANGHDSVEEPTSPSGAGPRDEPAPKRINPLRIHLGKRPFVDNSPPQYHSTSKKKKTFANRASETSTLSVPRVPKLIPNIKFHNVSSQRDSVVESERDKPVPRLVPKSQLLHFKKSKAEMESLTTDISQSLGVQTVVKFKCRKCGTMPFKTLGLLKEHQLECRPQGSVTTAGPETTTSAESGNSSGPSRVTRKVYLCSACGTYYENWNLFLHMREVHNRHICLFCLGMFSTAEKLSAHLSNKHRVKEFSYNTKEEFSSVYDVSLYLMCCVCEEIYSEKDDFLNHDCENVKPKPKPVPVLVSKNAVKPNKLHPPVNGPSTISKPPELMRDKKVLFDTKTESFAPQLLKLPAESNQIEQFSGNSNTEATNKEASSVTMPGTCDRSISKEVVSKLPPQPEQNKSMYNGDDSLEQSDESDSPMPDSPVRVASPPVVSYTPIDKEREGGIKLKLSLNNAKSPVIINSTVDPTVGIQHHNKPPLRVRKPPKRYEKEKRPEVMSQIVPRMPSIKMTICDKADNSFVKATVFENSQDMTLKGLLNNNLETIPKMPEFTPDKRIKSTIYDNKIEDTNSLNRVPKLTVRIPKELLDKDSSSDYSSDSDVSDKLTVDENNITTTEPEKSLEEIAPIETDPEPAVVEPSAPLEETLKEADPSTTEDIVQTTEEITEPKTEAIEQDTTVETTEEPTVVESPVTELTLDRPLDKYPLKELLKVFLQCTVLNCIYCNHVRKIAVNCEQLCLHMAAEHRFRATVDSITAEELLPMTIAAKVKASAPQLHHIFINLDSYDSEKKFEEVLNDNMFECFQCYFKTAVHKDLYVHNRKMHQKTILLCVMCKSNFYSYSELLCHLCPGAYDSDYEVKFRCCFCNVDNIPSSFRLMVHLRKSHHTCDVCLELCHNQARLSNHVWKHKLHHLCYRCGIAYRNKPDITNHLFWKHGTQSVLCKRCLQKKWPHVYHFCMPPAIFACDECTLQFTRAVYLKVHKRFHSNEFPHACTEEGCAEKFVSKKLLAKHLDDHRKKLLIENLSGDKLPSSDEASAACTDKPIPIIDLVNDDKPTEAGSSEITSETGAKLLSKKARKKKLKDKDTLLLEVNLPELNLSESDSSDESDSGAPPTPKVDKPDIKEQSADDTSLEEKSNIVDIKTDSIQIDTESRNDTETEAKSETVKIMPESVDKNAYPGIMADFIEDKAEPMKEQVDPVDGKIAPFDCKSDLVEEKEGGVEQSKYPVTEKEQLENQTGLAVGKADLPVGKIEPAAEEVESIEKQDAGKSEPIEDKPEIIEDKPDEKQVLEIWDNFKKYQEKVDDKPKERTPPLIPIKKHVCDSDHDYCLIPTDLNGDDDPFHLDRKKNKKGKMKTLGRFGLSSSSSDSSSDSSCSCGSNCSCSSSSTTTSSSTDSDSSDNMNEKKKSKQLRKKEAKRRLSTGSNVDVMGAVDTPVLIPEPVEPPVAETDLETDESDTDEEFYDEHPQKIANKLFAEKRNQLMLLASVAPSDGGSGEASRAATPPKPDMAAPHLNIDSTDKIPSSKKKSKKKKKSKSSKKREPIKINIPKDMIANSSIDNPSPAVAPNKITISLQSNTVHIPQTPVTSATTLLMHDSTATSDSSKRASKRRRVRNKFYGYSSDEDGPQTTTAVALKPTLPPKLEWRKEDLPSPVTHRPRKEIPSSVLASRLSESVRLTAPVPSAEPPRVIMTAESSSDEESSGSDSYGRGGYSVPPAIPPPSYLMSGTSSLPYAFAPPAVRQAREGESVYCYCRCPYDEVSEMIACDAEGCPIEWFHFECVGIMVPPKGKWYCPECRKNQSLSGYR